MRAFINGHECDFTPGETILEAARREGVFVPTLCHFSPLEHKPATCRVCLVGVEDEQGRRLATACDTPLAEGMRVDTFSREVRDRQRMQVELIFADHDQECVSCARHGDCELQDVGEALGLARNRFTQRLRPGPDARPLDESAAGLIRDMSKCVRCLRCVELCRQVQGVAALTVDGKGLAACVGVGASADQRSSACIQCGQCTLVCPTGALAERDQNDAVLDILSRPDLTAAFSLAPSARVLLGDEFGLPPGENVEGRVKAALRRLGADIVLDTNFGADVVIMEESAELLRKLTRGGPLPLFTSCCPAWVNFAEKHIPAILPHVSTTRSPQAALGALARTYLCERMGLDPARLRLIAIMPCVAKKDEIARPELGRGGRPDNDVVLTLREFVRLLRRMGVDLAATAPEPFDDPLMGESTGAAALFGASGGVMEAVLRALNARVNAGRELPPPTLAPLPGLEGARETAVDLGPELGTVRAAVCHGLRSARVLAEAALKGESPYAFVEVMACPGGCVNGGGNPRLKGDYRPQGRHRRREALHAIDRSRPLRSAHENPQVRRLYEEYLGEPDGERAHALLHTGYADRSEAGGESIQENRRRLTLTE